MARLPEQPTTTHNRLAYWLLGLTLVATLMVYGRMIGQDFVSYDDRLFIHINPYVLNGLSWSDFLWAFHIDTPSMWHPLTWLSYQVNAQISLWQGYPLTEPSPVSFKITNLLLHLVSTGLLFAALRCLTRKPLAAAMIAGIFALHPANVESVAWIAERKSALSEVFVMACLWTYAIYATQHKKQWLFITYGLFVLGLMSKPAILTLPVILLLLDYWPLQRSRWQGGTDTLLRLIAEKLPLLFLSLVDAVATYINGRIIKVVVPWTDHSIFERAWLLPITYVRYIFHAICPVTVGPMQTPEQWSHWQAAGAVGVLVALTLLAIWQVKRRPCLLVGWLWFVIALFPMSGFVKTSQESMADRHLYYAGLGLFIALVFLIAHQLEAKRWVLPTAVVVLMALGLSAYRHVQVWDNSTSLYTWAIAHTQNNKWAHNNLGSIDWLQGRFEPAKHQFELALAIDPNYAPAKENLQGVMGLIDAKDPQLAMLGFARYTREHGRLNDARLQLLEALVRWPRHPVVLLELAKTDLALHQRQRALYWLDQAGRSPVDSPLFAKEMAQLYQQADRPDQAAYWQKLISR